VARPRVYELQGVRDVELSPSLRAVVTPSEVLLLSGRETFRMTLREAQVLGMVVGPTDRVSLKAARSGGRG